MSVEAFPPLDISTKLAIAIGIGMLVGLEREWSQKDLGTRSFTITSIAGTLSVLAAPAFSYLAFAGVLLVIVLAGIRNLNENKPVETTTSAALIATFIMGVLVGQGHHYTPVAAAILMTMLLSLKPALTHFAGGLQVAEVQSAVKLGLLAFVIYPVLPDHPIDPWQLINPREAWLTVVVIAALGFTNYVLLKLYGSRGLYYSAVLGGMVNSTATIAELSGSLVGNAENQSTLPMAVTINFLTIVAMFIRNLLILGIFARAAVPAIAPLTAISLGAFACIWLQRKRATRQTAEARLSSPLSLAKVLKFGLIFLVIEIVGNTGQRYFGYFGFLLVSVIGGLVSSASTASAAATLAAHGKISAATAGLATVLTSMASALSNLPFLHQQIKRWPITRTLTVLSLCIVLAGVIAIFLSRKLLPD